MTDLFPDAPIPLRAQIAEVERELAQRARVYPRLIAAGKMTEAAAERQTATMRAVLHTLQEKPE